MRTVGAVLRQPGHTFSLEDLEIEAPRDDEVLVRITASGICHTDIGRAAIAALAQCPGVLGHEGAGVVEAVGAAVRAIAPGDRVLLTVDSCGRCDRCRAGRPTYCRSFRALNLTGTRLDGSRALSSRGEPVYGHFFGQSSFAHHALVHEQSIVKLDADAPLDLLAPLGCGVQTGAGSVLNVMQPPAGSSLAVFGAGSVGLSAIMAAAIVGCYPIIAVDIVPSRLALAEQLGATHTLLASGDASLAPAIIGLTGHGANFSFNTAAAPSAQRDAIACLDELGLCVTVALRASPEVADALAALGRGRSLRGSIEGDAVPQTFIPLLVELWRRGRLPLERMVGYFRFEEINDAIAASVQGEVVKPVIRFD